MTISTDEMLDQLSTIGKPVLMRMDSGWYAKLELPAPTGVQMEVKSDFGHPTHGSALIQLISRLGGIVEFSQKIRSSNLLVEGSK